MLLKLNFLLVFGYFSSIFAVTSPKVATGEELYETFVDKYEWYRQMAGCAAPLCNKTVGLRQTTTTTCPPGNICPAPRVEFRVSVISKCCSNCSCGEDCERDRTCCPDKLVSFPKHGKYHLGGVYDCCLTSVKENPKLGQSYRSMISHCDVNYKNDYVISLCEKTDPDSLEQYVPVFQTKTKEAYKNKFCSMCNFIDDDELQMWTIHLKCQDNAVFIYKSLKTIVPELRQHKKCNIVFEKPSNFNLPPSCEPLISTCNETGKWIQYDYFTEKACSSYSAPYRQYSKRYRNIFCFLCNMNERSLNFDHCSLSTHMGKELRPISISFAVILNFNEAIPELQQEVEEPESCSRATVYDHYYVSTITRVQRRMISGVNFLVFLRLLFFALLLLYVT